MRAASKEMGLSQQEIADAIGTTLETVSKCERGASAPSVEVFLALVRVLDLRVADMIDEAAPRGTVSAKRSRREHQNTVQNIEK